MKSIQQVSTVGLSFFLTTLLSASSALAQQVTQTTPANPSSPSMAAGTATAGIAISAVIQILFVAVLVIALLAGGMLVLNMGLLSKRSSDRTGSKDPSDLALLHNERFPEDAYDEKALPAREERDDRENAEAIPSRSAPNPTRAA